MSTKPLDRRAVAAALLRDRGDLLVVAGLGGTTIWLQGATYDASMVYQGVTNIESVVLGSL